MTLVVGPFEAFFHTACGGDAKNSQSWWGYVGETTMSTLGQMLVLTARNFVSAARPPP